MRTLLLCLCYLLLQESVLPAQNKTIIVKAGTKILDYFPLSERYRYPEFVTGQIFLKNGSAREMKLNYSILAGEMEFIQSSDTLEIANSRKKEIKYVVASDTFYYDKGFIEIIDGGAISLGLKHYVRIKDILKKGAYGTTSRGASIDTYKSMSSNGISYDLVPNEDIELEDTREYYIYTADAGFTLFTKKNVLRLFPADEDRIKSYLKSERVNFNSGEDLIRFTDFLRNL
jgi:hypothetical protein